VLARAQDRTSLAETLTVAQAVHYAREHNLALRRGRELPAALPLRVTCRRFSARDAEGLLQSVDTVLRR
jgi:hypothetical protein